jgi:hypothetical protein
MDKFFIPASTWGLCLTRQLTCTSFLAKRKETYFSSSVSGLPNPDEVIPYLTLEGEVILYLAPKDEFALIWNQLSILMPNVTLLLGSTLSSLSKDVIVLMIKFLLFCAIMYCRYTSIQLVKMTKTSLQHHLTHIYCCSSCPFMSLHDTVFS